jgi:hypothetical protein
MSVSAATLFRLLGVRSSSRSWTGAKAIVTTNAHRIAPKKGQVIQAIASEAATTKPNRTRSSKVEGLAIFARAGFALISVIKKSNSLRSTLCHVQMITFELDKLRAHPF